MLGLPLGHYLHPDAANSEGAILAHAAQVEAEDLRQSINLVERWGEYARSCPGSSVNSVNRDRQLDALVVRAMRIKGISAVLEGVLLEIEAHS